MDAWRASRPPRPVLTLDITNEVFIDCPFARVLLFPCMVLVAPWPDLGGTPLVLFCSVMVVDCFMFCECCCWFWLTRNEDRRSL